jgi:hypothetical protein
MIHQLARENRLDLLKEVLRLAPELDLNVKQSSPDNRYPVHTALSLAGSVEIGRLLLDNGAKLESYVYKQFSSDTNSPLGLTESMELADLFIDYMPNQFSEAFTERIGNIPLPSPLDLEIAGKIIRHC